MGESKAYLIRANSMFAYAIDQHLKENMIGSEKLEKKYEHYLDVLRENFPDKLFTFSRKAIDEQFSIDSKRQESKLSAAEWAELKQFVIDFKDRVLRKIVFFLRQCSLKKYDFTLAIMVFSEMKYYDSMHFEKLLPALDACKRLDETIDSEIKTVKSEIKSEKNTDIKNLLERLRSVLLEEKKLVNLELERMNQEKTFIENLKKSKMNQDTLDKAYERLNNKGIHNYTSVARNVDLLYQKGEYDLRKSITLIRNEVFMLTPAQVMEIPPQKMKEYEVHIGNVIAAFEGVNRQRQVVFRYEGKDRSADINKVKVTKKSA